VTTTCPPSRVKTTIASSATLIVTTADLASASAVGACSPSYIGVPGSGQSSSSSKEMSRVGSLVAAKATNAGLALRHNVNLSYPAVAWYRYIAPSLSLNWNGLGKSEATGEASLIQLINSYRGQASAAGCASAPILLAGYSQGAEVVIRTVDALPAATRKTIAVALLGNPSFTPGRAGDYNQNKATYRGIRPSLVAGQRYNTVSDVLPRTIDICAPSDPICAFHKSELLGLADGRSAHYHYTTLTTGGITLTQRAANSLWAHKPTATPDPQSMWHGGFAATVDQYATTGDSGHKGPGDQYAAGPTHPAGATIHIYCYVNGEAITNSHYGDTTTVWDLSDDGYFYTDAWLFTDSNGPVVPPCR
jgi:hypothetical protein